MSFHRLQSSPFIIHNWINIPFINTKRLKCKVCIIAAVIIWSVFYSIFCLFMSFKYPFFNILIHLSMLLLNFTTPTPISIKISYFWLVYEFRRLHSTLTVRVISIWNIFSNHKIFWMNCLDSCGKLILGVVMLGTWYFNSSFFII